MGVAQYILLLIVSISGFTAARYCHRPDFDCYGHDIRDAIGNISYCMKACEEEPECRGFQANLMTQKCYLKTKACKNHETVLAVGANDFFRYDGKCGKF